MDPWESVIVVAASLAGVFFAVMGFRGLVGAFERTSGRCDGCGRVAMLPLPRSHECRRCHHRMLSLHPFSSGLRIRH